MKKKWLTVLIVCVVLMFGWIFLAVAIWRVVKRDLDMKKDLLVWRPLTHSSETRGKGPRSLHFFV